MVSEFTGASTGGFRIPFWDTRLAFAKVSERPLPAAQAIGDERPKSSNQLAAHGQAVPVL
jgi:hypothetical protein